MSQALLAAPVPAANDLQAIGISGKHTNAGQSRIHGNGSRAFLRWMQVLGLKPFRVQMKADRFSMQPGQHIVYARNLQEAVEHAADQP
jgi:hypothetical protein